MPITKEITLYTYDELSDSAKDKARDWWNGCRDEFDYEFVIEDFKEVAKLLGINFKTHTVRLMSGASRQDANIWWSLDYCQSDYAAFEGWWTYAPAMAKKIRDYAPQDSTLHGITDTLADVQRRHFYKLEAAVTYHHYYGLQVEVGHTEDRYREIPDADYKTVKEAMKDLCQWLYHQLQTQDEWLGSEENIADAMSANGYTFTKDGRRED